MDPDPKDQGRTALKRQAILEAARTLFLRHGFAGTSMDQVAAAAKVSKQTVYKQFSDKEQLFASIIAGDIAAAEDLSRETLDRLEKSDDFAEALEAFARQHIVEVLQPHLIQLRRTIIGEAGRFPELARTWYERAPARGVATLAGVFERAAQRGHLKLDDPLLAAEHFNWLVLSIPLNRAMFLIDEEPDEDELKRFADEGVRVFLAAYGVDGRA